MVFVSLESVVEESAAGRGPHEAQPCAPLRVVVTPGSAAKCAAGSATGAPVTSAPRGLARWWRGAGASHFVCFVTDGVVQHKWVVVRRAAECAALRKRLLRAASDCASARSKRGACSCRAVRALVKASSRSGGKALATHYAEARALEELLNALLGEMLGGLAGGACAAAGGALAAVEGFLDVEARRADAVDRLVRRASASAAPEADAPLEEERTEQPRAAESECSICCGALAGGELAALRLPCGHAFHGDCVRLWLRVQQTCPECHVAARVAA